MSEEIEKELEGIEEVVEDLEELAAYGFADAGIWAHALRFHITRIRSLLKGESE